MLIIDIISSYVLFTGSTPINIYENIVYRDKMAKEVYTPTFTPQHGMSSSA